MGRTILHDAFGEDRTDARKCLDLIGWRRVEIY